MSDERKKPGAAFWMTVALVLALVLLLAYPLSIGPYWWLHNHITLPVQIENALNAFYDPIWKTCWSGPDWFGNVIRDYLGWWADGVTLAPRPA